MKSLSVILAVVVVATAGCQRNPEKDYATFIERCMGKHLKRGEEYKEAYGTCSFVAERLVGVPTNVR